MDTSKTIGSKVKERSTYKAQRNSLANLSAVAHAARAPYISTYFVNDRKNGEIETGIWRNNQLAEQF